MKALWERNRTHLDLTDTLSYSPYVCLIEGNFCESGDHTWQFEEGNQDEILLSESERASSKLIAPFANRPPLVSLVQGGLALRKNKRAEAVAVWKQEPMIAHYLALLASQIDDPELAIEVYNLSLDVAPTASTYYRLGRQLFQLERYGEARSALMHSAVLLEGSSENLHQSHGPFIFLYLGHTYRHLGEFDLARASYEQALALNEGWAGAILGLAQVDVAQNKHWLAIQRLEPLVNRNPSSPAPYYQLALVYMEVEDLPVARNVAEQLTIEYVDYLPGWQLLGNIAFQQDDYSASLDAYEHYLQRRPDDPQVKQRIEELKEMLGEK